VALGGVVPVDDNTAPGSPYKGQVRARRDLSFTATPGPLEVYDGAAWQPAVPTATTPASMPRGIMAAPISTTANGTATPGTTADTLDTVLGNYQFTATAGRR